MTTDSIHAEIGQPAWLRVLARAISIVFHPVFIGVFMMYYLTFVEYEVFLGVDDSSKLLKCITFANNNLLFPLLIVGLLRALGFSRSLRMDTSKERIVPYIAVIIFQFWTWHVFRNQSNSPGELNAMCLGIFLAASLALVVNNFIKVSMHAIGMGGLTGLIVSIGLLGYAQEGFHAVAAVLLSGMVCTSRMIQGSHDIKEILTGFSIGFATQYGCQIA